MLPYCFPKIFNHFLISSPFPVQFWSSPASTFHPHTHTHPSSLRSRKTTTHILLKDVDIFKVYYLFLIVLTFFLHFHIFLSSFFLQQLYSYLHFWSSLIWIYFSDEDKNRWWIKRKREFWSLILWKKQKIVSCFFQRCRIVSGSRNNQSKMSAESTL